MEWTLPGTVLSVDADRPQAAEEVFSSLFLAGGLVLSQVTQVTGLEPYIIQNWVRRGFLAPPKQRKYTRRAAANQSAEHDERALSESADFEKGEIYV